MSERQALEIVESDLEKRAAEVIANQAAQKKPKKAPLPATAPWDNVPPPNWLDVNAIVSDMELPLMDYERREILTKWASEIYRGAFEEGCNETAKCCGCSGPEQGSMTEPFTGEEF